MNIPINAGLIFFSSSSCSAAFPIGTFPLLVIFPLNLLDRLRMLRGAGFFHHIFLFVKVGLLY